MENTVLVLGAGFSKPYGYPTGPELVQSIISKFSHAHSELAQSFARDLADSGIKSIDRFLYENKQFHEMGVEIIVQAIANAEIDSLTYKLSDDDDIIGHLIQQLEPENFKKLKIITFNYDRLLEFKILKMLQIKYRSIEKAREVLATLEIEHIHGRMPLLKDLETFDQSPFNYKYGLEGASQNHRTWVLEKIIEHSKSFHTIYTNDPAPNPKAISSLKWAKRVFFLGFAFDELNMKKLGIGGTHYAWQSKYVAGTAYKLAPIQKLAIMDRHAFLQDRLFDVSAKKLFTHHYSINSTVDIESTDFSNKWSCCEANAYQEQPEDLRSFSLRRLELICPWCEQEESWKYKLNQDGTVAFCRTNESFILKSIN